MGISIQCPGCEKNLKVKDELAGKRIKCPGCGTVLAAPAAKPAPLSHPAGLTATFDKPTARVFQPSDPLGTTDHVPDLDATPPSPTNDLDSGKATLGVDCTADFAHRSSPVEGEMDAEVSGQARESRDGVPEHGPETVSVPGYEIEEELGRGGMGVVYKARHLSLKRTVALKMVLAGGHAGPRELARFRIEAEAVARLAHPNIVQIHEVGEAGGHPYCALEFIEGGNLADKLDGKPLPAREAATLVETLGRAMQLAHSRNVVHRDLKPANILLTAEGTPKITDFGLARQLDSVNTESLAGAVLGTPSYMAPEQASGHSHDAGPAADVYALGAILYTCLAGRPPFRGKTVVETLDQVRTQEPKPPSRWQAGVPLDVETVCLKCLRKEPERRYSSAAELADDLGRFLRGEPVQARPVGQLERGWRWCQRTPAVASLLAAVTVLLAAVGLALLLGVAFSSWFALLAHEEAKKASQQAEAARKAEKKEAAEAAAARKAEQEADTRAHSETEAKEKAEWLVYAGKLSLAQSAFQEGKGALALQLLNECQWNRRGWEHRYLWTRFNSKQTFTGYAGIVSSVAFSPDGKRIVTGNQAGTASVWDAATGQRLLSLGKFDGNAKKWITSVAFSPDGKRILTGSGNPILRNLPGEVKVWDAATGQELLALKGHPQSVHSVAFSPNGKRILTGSADNTAKVWDAATGQELLALNGHTDKVSSVAFSPDGTRIVTGSWDKTARVWDAATGQELLALKGLGIEVQSVAFSPDGKRIVAGSGGVIRVDESDINAPGSLTVSVALDSKPIIVWDAATGQELLAPKGKELANQVTSVSFSPDGTRIVTGSWDNTVKVWDAVKGQELLSLKGHTQLVTSVSFSPDGTRIVTGSYDQTAKVWDAVKGQELLSLKVPKGEISCVAFSPDSKRILTGNRASTVTVWDVAKGRELLSFKGKGHTGAVHRAVFSPDGKRLLTVSADKTAKVWDAATGQELLSLNGHTDQIPSVSFSPDGTRIVTGSADHTVKVWDAATGHDLFSLNGHTDKVYSVAFSPDGKRIVTGSADHTAKVWDAEKGQELLTLKGHSAAVLWGAFTWDGKRIVTGGTDAVKVWDAATGHELLSLKGQTSEIHYGDISRDGTRIVTGSYNKTATVWDAATGQELLSLKGHTQPLLRVAFSPDGKRIVTGSGELNKPGEAKVWDAATGHELFSLKGHTTAVSSVSFSPDGKRILTGSWDGTVKVWDAETGQELFSLNERKDLASRSIVSVVSFSPDGKRIVTGSEDGTAKVWDAATGQEIFQTAHTQPFRSVAFNRDGTRILTGSFSFRQPGEAKVWNAATGQELLSLRDPSGITSETFSPDGKRIVTGSYDNTAKVWDAATGQELLSLKGHTNNVSSVAFSPDGKRILTGSWDKTAKVWDAATGQELFSLQGHSGIVHSVAFSLDGKRILTGSEEIYKLGNWDMPRSGEVKVWDAATGQELLSLKGHTTSVISVAFSPDGTRILTGSRDGTAKVWDAEKGQELLTLKVPKGEISSVAFSPDGKRIVTGSKDGATVWDGEKGPEVLSLKGHTNYVSSVAFSPDGKRIFAWDTEHKVLAWSVADGKPVKPSDPPPMPRPGTVALSPDRSLQAFASGTEVRVLHIRRQPSSEAWPLPDLAERRRYHSEQADLAEKEKQWFAAAFHLGRLLLDSPEDAGLKRRREQALKNATLTEEGPRKMPRPLMD